MNAKGRVIDNRYELGDCLGGGSVGQVYRAVDSIRGENVAIKILHEDVVEERGGIKELAALLRRASSLSHPGIARIYDFNQWEKKVYLIMEHLKGPTLADLLADGEFPSPEIWIPKLLEALEYGTARIPHLGIKPENIWFPESGGCKWTDFGLNGLLTPESYTNSASLLRRAQYLAPECYEGAAGEEADQFALGQTWRAVLDASSKERTFPERRPWGERLTDPNP